jgi:3-oxosteroid 1-dehydrogenase
LSATPQAHDPYKEHWWLAAYEADSPQRPQATSASDEETFDVVVVGGGMAGYCSAIFTADQGCSVLMLEAAGEAGGTTFKSGAGMWIPHNSLREARGLPEEREWAFHHMAKLAYPEEYEPGAERLGLGEPEYALITAFYDNGKAAMDELQRLGMPLMEFPSFTGDYEAMVEYHNELEHGFGMHLSPRQLNGLWGGGAHLVDALARIARERAIELRTEHRVLGVVQNDDGEVVGVHASTPDSEVDLYARRGVIFATGGYAHNRELTDEYFPARLYGSCSVRTGKGDFIAIAEALGAELGNMGRGWGTQHPVEIMLRDSEIADHVPVIPGDSSLMVDASGRRVVNEKYIYHERSMIHWEPGENGDFPYHLLFAVYDDFVAYDETPTLSRYPPPDPSDDHYWVISGQTVEALAEAIDARLAEYGERVRGFRLKPGFAGELAASIARYNEFARAGRDEQFHRGETDVELDWTGPSHADNTANRSMYPLNGGPYHCVILAGGVLDTNGGPKTTPDGRIVRTDGTTIPGLFGVGNCVASVAGAGYWSGGSTLGPAATFAYLASRAVAGEAARLVRPQEATA